MLYLRKWKICKCENNRNMHYNATIIIFFARNEEIIAYYVKISLINKPSQIIFTCVILLHSYLNYDYIKYYWFIFFHLLKRLKSIGFRQWNQIRINEFISRWIYRRFSCSNLVLSFWHPTYQFSIKIQFYSSQSQVNQNSALEADPN